MVAICFLTSQRGMLLGFSITGHAGWGEEGADIVCAAVSSAAYLTVNIITDVLSVAPLALRAEEGDLFFRILEGDASQCRPLLQGLKLYFSQLEEQYPDHIEVSHIEIEL